MLHRVNNTTTEKLGNFFKTPMDSDAVFHEESEYAIGLMIRAIYDGMSSIFR